MNDRNDTLSSRVLCLVVSISDMHTKKEEERKEKGKIRENGDTLENHKGNVRKARERERERGIDFSNVGRVQFGQLFGKANLWSRVISFVTESRGKMEETLRLRLKGRH